jgi:hypothetical protein
MQITPRPATYSPRRSDHDVTNTVRVSSAADVRDAVQQLFERVWPSAPFAPVARAFHDFELAFTGRMPGYFGVDTVYHDQQHTLDVTLAMARLMAGYEMTHAATPRALGAERAAVGVFLALFHDIGYLRERSEEARNGAEFTRNHVSRSARFMDYYLPTIGFAHWTGITSQVVHFTGYEVPFDVIGKHVPDARDIQLGHLLGTADMIAQMADRCYLEKCRDRLYPEFVLGGVALPIAANGGRDVRYANGSTRHSIPPTAISNCCSTAATRTLNPSIAASRTCARSCAARAGGCCGAVRRCLQQNQTPSPMCAA